MVPFILDIVIFRQKRLSFLRKRFYLRVFLIFWTYFSRHTKNCHFALSIHVESNPISEFQAINIIIFFFFSQHFCRIFTYRPYWRYSPKTYTHDNKPKFISNAQYRFEIKSGNLWQVNNKWHDVSCWVFFFCKFFPRARNNNNNEKSLLYNGDIRKERS